MLSIPYKSIIKVNMLSIPYSVFIVNFEHISHLCSSVSIVNFKQVIAGWVRFKSQLIGTAWLRVT